MVTKRRLSGMRRSFSDDRLRSFTVGSETRLHTHGARLLCNATKLEEQVDDALDVDGIVKDLSGLAESGHEYAKFLFKSLENVDQHSIEGVEAFLGSASVVWDGGGKEVELGMVADEGAELGGEADRPGSRVRARMLSAPGEKHAELLLLSKVCLVETELLFNRVLEFLDECSMQLLFWKDMVIVARFPFVAQC